MSVSLYDLLDVDEEATPDQIRAAWKAAIADLDPTDRKFRAFNDAAGVLLDENKRAAYDAELAADRADEPEEPVEPAATTPPESKFAQRAEEPADDGSASAASTAADAVAADTVDDPPKMKQPKPEKTVPRSDSVSTGPTTLALVVAGIGAVLALALAIVVLSWPGSVGGDSPKDQVAQAEKAEDAGIDAENAAANAVPAVLSYDYRTLDEDFAEAEAFLTDDFAAKRNELFDQTSESGMTLREQVVTDKVVVTAAGNPPTGLTRVSPDGSRATVVVYVDQDSQRGKEAPRSLRMWATVSMVADGDEWLLDDICTETDCD